MRIELRNGQAERGYYRHQFEEARNRLAHITMEARMNGHGTLRCMFLN